MYIFKKNLKRTTNSKTNTNVCHPSLTIRKVSIYKYHSSKVHLSKTCQMKSSAVPILKTENPKTNQKPKIGMSERAADIFSKNYLHTCTDYFFSLSFKRNGGGRKKKGNIKKRIHMFTLSRGDN